MAKSLYKIQKKEQKDLLTELNKYYDEAKAATKHRRTKWKLHYNYWVNKQLSATRPKYKSDIRVNYCFFITQTKIPVMTQNRPTVNFISYDTSAEIEGTAQVMSKLVGNALWNKLKIQDELIDVCLASEIYDAGFWKVVWDPEEGEEGEVYAKAVDPFKILIDPFSNSIKDARYVIHIEAYPVSTLKRRYKDFANKIAIDKSISDILYEDRKFGDRKPSTAGVFNELTEFENERVLLKEFWIAPIKDEKGKICCPGRVITMIGDNVIVENKENKYEHGGFPFVKQVSNKVVNEFYGIGDIEQIVPLQDALNHAYQQVDDIATKTANVGWTAHPSLGSERIKKVAALLGRPGQVKIADPEKLKEDKAPQMPSYLIRRIDGIKEEIRVISGINDILSGGKVTHRTARGLERLYEASTSRIGLSVRLMEDSLKEVAYLMASVAAQFYKQDRKFALIGSSGGVTGILNVPLNSLKGKFEISIDSGTALPRDKQSRADLVFNLLKNSIFEMALSDDPVKKKMAEIVLEATEFPGREAILDFKSEEVSQPPQTSLQQGPPLAAPALPPASLAAPPPVAPPPIAPPPAPPIPAAPAPIPPGIIAMAAEAKMSPEEFIQMMKTSGAI